LEKIPRNEGKLLFVGNHTIFGIYDMSPSGVLPAAEGGREHAVIPGGGREVAKRKGEKYKLMWRDTTDFVRIAIRCGATIVPFSTIGVEDAFDVLMDPEEIMASPLGPWLKPALQATGLHTAPFPSPPTLACCPPRAPLLPLQRPHSHRRP
ncbi:hypothetical protein CLOP_g3334, partial [Closterium sp. NIES-67]